MKAEHINPVIQGAQVILTRLCGETADMGKLTLKTGLSDVSEIAVVIGLRGQLNGYAVFSMKHCAGRFLAQKFLNGAGMPVADDEADELLPSVLGEIANQISGKIAALYFDIGIKNDITPPSFAEPPPAGFFNFVPNNAKLVSIPLMFKCGNTLEINMCFT